ncbi:PE-PGRS family protein [Streptomyces erythrochromogenes]|uniref:PE-PGRS family protein n=1 Tax=Streptomyces erythrochromogenes TaxID=285574 RepID=UPI0038641FAB|nr:PE-PGRS family protein [Streptomyces erythrochromogenes]
MSMRSVGDTEGDWAGLFVGIEALAALPSMRQAWLSGLTCVAPADVVVRLLDVTGSLAVLDLPAEAVDAAIAHPDRRVRARLAESRRDMSIDQWVRLIAGEASGADRRRFQRLATWYCPKVPAAEFERWARDPDPGTRLQALWFRGLPQRLALDLTADPDPEVRAEACAYAWPYLDGGRRGALVDDPSPQVQDVARRRAAFDRPMSRTAFDGLTTMEQWRAIPAQRLERDLAEYLVRRGESGLRTKLVGDERLDADLIHELAHDEDPHVRASVAVRADVTEELRASISAGLPADTPYWGVDWVEELHDDPEAMRRLASSASIGIRRSVARARHLPSDVVDRLARDPDTHVQYNLASCCQDAPAELLLEFALRPNGSFLALSHPNFPRHTLLRFADDPDPRRRRLALESPDSTPGLAERFADDPDERLRAWAAADPRLSPTTVLRLLDSTPRTRKAALRNPRLPVPTLIRLLRDADHAEDAAANPAIPRAVVRQLIELSCAAVSPSG